jgi:hypothetical protein
MIATAIISLPLHNRLYNEEFSSLALPDFDQKEPTPCWVQQLERLDPRNPGSMPVPFKMADDDGMEHNAITLLRTPQTFLVAI